MLNFWTTSQEGKVRKVNCNIYKTTETAKLVHWLQRQSFLTIYRMFGYQKPFQFAGAPNVIQRYFAAQKISYW